MRTLLVSADLTADEIPATGGHRRFVPFRESHKESYLTRQVNTARAGFTPVRAVFYLFGGGRCQNCCISSIYCLSSLTGMRFCSMVSRSRTVTVPVSSVSKSTVMHTGVPTSSWRR